MKTVNTIREVIAEMGGAAAVAGRYDVTRSAVYIWGRHGKFPLYLKESLEADAEVCEFAISPDLFRYERKKKMGRAA